MKAASGALISILSAGGPFQVADLYTITLPTATVIRYTTADFDITVGGFTFLSSTSQIKRGTISTGIGVEVQQLEITILPSPAELFTGLTWWTAALNGFLDGARVLLERVFYLGTPHGLAGHNLVLRSQELDNAYWTKALATVTTDSIAAPDATTTADKLIAGATSSVHAVTSSNTVKVPSVANIAGTISVYARAAQLSRLQLKLAAPDGSFISAKFNLLNETWDTLTANGTGIAMRASITNEGSGWFRCAVTGIVSAAVDLSQVSILLADSTGAVSFLGDAVIGLYLWGIQYSLGELGPYVGTTSVEVVTAWPDVSAGSVILFGGRVAEVKLSRSLVTLQVKSDIELANIQMPRIVYENGCVHELYDGGCGLVKTSFQASGFFTNTSQTAPTTNGIGTSDGYWDLGYVDITGGANAGLKRTVKHYDAATSTLELLYGLPNPVQYNDAFTVYAGCDKRQATCSGKFSNIARFKGMPFIPAPETLA